MYFVLGIVTKDSNRNKGILRVYLPNEGHGGMAAHYVYVKVHTELHIE